MWDEWNREANFGYFEPILQEFARDSGMECNYSTHDEPHCVLEWMHEDRLCMIVLQPRYSAAGGNFMRIQIRLPNGLVFGEGIGSMKETFSPEALWKILEKAKVLAETSTPNPVLSPYFPGWYQGFDPEKMTPEEFATVRRPVNKITGKYRDESTTPGMIKYLSSTEEAIRYSHAIALGNHGDERALKPLEETLNDPSERVRAAAKEAIQKIREAYDTTSSRCANLKARQI